jgi:hypothetical protein
MNNKTVFRKQTKIVAYGICTCLLSSCAARNTGTFGIGNPVALPPEQSMESFKSYAKSMQDRVTLKEGNTNMENLDPLKPNRITRIEYANVAKGRVDVATGSSTLPSAGQGNEEVLPTPNAVSIISDDDKPDGLLMDKISSLDAFVAHKQRFYDLSCLYQDSEKSLYKVMFTLWIEPERQNAWDYLWRWATPEGFRNYTKDYHVDVGFKIKNKDVPIKVVRLEPEHEGSVSNEYSSLMSRSQLGISARWSEIGANGELVEQLREAEIEQRKYPILRGVIETKETTTNASDFHFIISPRQHVEKRMFRIPYLTDAYSVARRLESVPYNVSAYFLVNKIKPVDLKKTLTLEVTACYKEYGIPEHSCDDNHIVKTLNVNVDLLASSDNAASAATESCSVSPKKENVGSTKVTENVTETTTTKDSCQTVIKLKDGTRTISNEHIVEKKSK